MKVRMPQTSLKKLSFLKNIFLILIMLPLLSFSFFPFLQVEKVKAQTTNQGVEIPLADYFTLKSGVSVQNVFSTPSDMINLIVKVLFVAAGLVLFLMLIIAGFGMIRGDSKNAEQAKKTATTAVIGFIIMFAAYWIMQIIKLVTGADIGF